MPSAFDLAGQQQSRGLRKAIALPFAQLWHGLNRAVSPQDLDGSESPDTTDTCSFQSKIGALGPRPGRARVTSTPDVLLGLGMLILPTGSIRVLAQNDGTWTCAAVPFQAPITPTPPFSGFEEINATFAPAATAGDTSTGAEYDVGSYDLSKYSKVIVTYGSFAPAEYEGGTTTETYSLTLQAYIDGSWQDYDGSATSGTLTKLRMSINVDPASTDVSTSVPVNVFLVKGAPQGSITVP